MTEVKRLPANPRTRLRSGIAKQHFAQFCHGHACWATSSLTFIITRYKKAIT
jgi:hypothetical protein